MYLEMTLHRRRRPRAASTAGPKLGALAPFAVAVLALVAGRAVPAAEPAFDFDSALGSAGSMARMHSLLVSHDGEIVLERYFNGRDRDDIANVKSVSKSVVSALVGIAIERGYLSGVDEPIGGYFEAELGSEADAAKRAITIEDLLTMRSGLETTSNRNYGAWVLSPNWIEFALDQPLEAEPGERMQYSTGSTHLLSAILTQATGESTLEFAREALGDPLGFHLASWPRDPQGVYFGGNDMEFTPRQMLAFGNLYLHRGRANGRQIVPAEWVDASFTPRTESPREEGRYYGYGWWIRTMAGFETPYAWGYGGQFIVLVPDLDAVVVITSSSTPGDDRRRHTRNLYDLVEFEVIPALARALGDG
jgi:CubicO group peptidase (beta-lactamase class C family)